MELVKGEKRKNLLSAEDRAFKKEHIKKELKRCLPLYSMMAVPLLFFIVVRYFPMYGLQIAFRDYSALDGIWGSEWVGMKEITRFVTSYNFWNIIRNTLAISFYELLVAFPIPILLALSLNSIKNGPFKKTVQMVSYAPHFISVVVMCGLILQVLSPRTGVINQIISFFGGEQVNFIGEPQWFSTIFVFSGIWQNAGWGTIIYLASLSSVDYQLHEAAIIDGATKAQRVWNIDFMTILPMVITMLIMNVGRMLQVGFQKVLLLQNPLNISSSQVIQTYVYEVGLASTIADFSYATAIGLFTSVINLILLSMVNKIARRLSDTSLW